MVRRLDVYMCVVTITQPCKEGGGTICASTGGSTIDVRSAEVPAFTSTSTGGSTIDVRSAEVRIFIYLVIMHAMQP